MVQFDKKIVTGAKGLLAWLSRSSCFGDWRYYLKLFCVTPRFDRRADCALNPPDQMGELHGKIKSHH